MALYAKPTQVAVRILVQMAAGEVERVWTGGEVASAARVSAASTSKLLQTLTKGGILVSRKGPGGGFRLALPPSEISLGRIVEAVEGNIRVTECVGGFPWCQSGSQCSVHRKWEPVKEKMAEFLESTSLAEMLDAYREMVEFVEK